MKPVAPVFFNFNGRHVAIIGKSGSSAIAQAIVFASRPGFKVVSASGDQDKVTRLMERPGWQSLAPKTKEPVNPAILVRDPVERFRSACAQDRVSAEEQLKKVEAGEFSFHTRPVADYLITDSLLFRFPDHLNEVAAHLGVSEIPKVNDGEKNNGKKPKLTKSELARVREVYRRDIELFESIKEPGTEWKAQHEAESPALLPSFSASAHGLRIAWIRLGRSLEEIVKAIDGIQDPVNREMIRAYWEYSTNVASDSEWMVTLAEKLRLSPEEFHQWFTSAQAA